MTTSCLVLVLIVSYVSVYSQHCCSSSYLSNTGRHMTTSCLVLVLIVSYVSVYSRHCCSSSYLSNRETYDNIMFSAGTYCVICQCLQSALL